MDLAGGESAARRELAKAALWEAWRRWRRLGRFGAEKIYFVLMMVIYALMAPFVVLAALLRPPHKGWTVPLEEAEADAAAARARSSREPVRP